MEQSRNVLVIESIIINPPKGDIVIRYSGELNASVRFYCPVTGNNYATIQLVSQGSGIDESEVVRNAIENFMNGIVSTRNQLYDREFKCETVRNKLDQLSVFLPQPFKDLFEQLFNAANWKIPDLQIKNS